MADLIGSDLTQKIQNLYSICNDCGSCSLTCPTHFVGIFNPMGVIRKLQMEGIGPTIKTEPIYNCLTCNRCMTNCPNSHPERGMDFAHLILYLRQYAVQNNIISSTKLPTGVGAILYSQKEKLLVSKNIEMLKSFFHLQYAKKGRIAFFMGDLFEYHQKMRLKFANWGEIAQASINILNRIGITPVVLNMYGSGHDDYWAGYIDIVNKIAKKNCSIYEKAQVSTIICADSESYYMWKCVYPQLIDDFHFQVMHLSEILLQNKNFKKLGFDVPLKVDYSFQDVSRLGRMNGKLYSEPRKILDFIPKLDRVELEANREESYDLYCGIHLEESEAVLEMWKNRILEIAQTNTKHFITTSPKSIITYERFMQNHADLLDHSEKIPSIKDWAVFLSRFLY